MWLPSTGSGPEFIEGSTGFGFLIVGAIKQEMIRQFFVHVLFAYCLIAIAYLITLSARYSKIC